MKRTVLSLIGAALLSLFAATAAAEFCDKCRDKMYTADIGQCTACGGHTSSGAFKLCSKCSGAQQKCQVCLAQLGGAGAPTGETTTPPGKPSAGKRSKGIELTDADNGKTIKVVVGKPLTIALEGNITTGYGWQTGKIDGASVRAEGKPEYAAKKHPAGMVGVGGTFVFRFKAVKPGKSEIKLVYLRPWEKDTPPAKSFVVKIEAEPK
jgi:inhibitor of cysteine peptidase